MSDSNMPNPNALVVGTAGHIDHGKTSLVYALTGIDTDKLKEEKERGISIDLGFALMPLTGGPTISFVDVPGHERFVRNMLAGAAGMEAVLLVVAANESVMPQTREHFQVCQLLGMKHGVIALTKSDLATPDEIQQTKQDVRQLVAGSFLDAAPVVAVSALTKVGLPELKRQLGIVATRDTGRDYKAVMRMPIDRAFAVKGFGTVVTGTLLAGSIRVGETVELLPRKIKARVRGLQAQHAPVEQAMAGQRLAVNLAGVDHQSVKRGHVMASADALSGSRILDVDLHWLDADAQPAPRELFVLHIGTAEAKAKVGIYKNGFARLRLMEEVIALPGDRFVLRRPSPAQTVGGGLIVDAFPPARLNRVKTQARLAVLKKLTLAQRIEFLLDEGTEGRKLGDLVRATGAGQEQILAAISANQNIIVSTDNRAVTRRWIQAKRQILAQWLQAFHVNNPNAAGALLSAARMSLDAALAAIVFGDFDDIRIQGETVSLASHKAKFSQRETAALQKMEDDFRSAGFQPPSTADVIAKAGVDQKKARTLLDSLLKDNRLIKLPDELIFHADVIAHIRNSLAQHPGRKFSVAEFKTWINISRKFAIPLLEYLDQQRITRREGDVRIVQ